MSDLPVNPGPAQAMMPVTGPAPRKRVRGLAKAATIDLTPHLAPVTSVLALTGQKAAPGWLDALRAALAPAIAQAVAAYAASLLAGHKQAVTAEEAKLERAAMGDHQMETQQAGGREYALSQSSVFVPEPILFVSAVAKPVYREGLIADE